MAIQESLKGGNQAKNFKMNSLSAAKNLSLIYETITSKLPDTTESRVLLKLVMDLEKMYAKNPKLADSMCEGVSVSVASEKAKLSAWTMVVNSIYNLDITKTRE